MGARARPVPTGRGRPDVGQLMVLALLVLTPVAVFVALRVYPSLDFFFQSVRFHVLVVSAIAGCALVVALLAGVAAARSRRASLAMLALACLSVGIFMFAHGLTTPGIWGRPMNLWVARFPVVALAGFAACLGAAVLSPEHPILRFVERHVRAVILVPSAIAALACALAVIWPDAWIGARPFPGELVASRIVSGLSAGALLVTGEIHRRRWRLSRDGVDLALLLACWMSTEAILSLHLGRLWHLSWWDYHVLLFVGFSTTAYAVVASYRRSRSAEGALESVVLRSTFEQIEHGYPEAVRSLVSAVEAKDSYTQGHSGRVAQLSLRIGERMGLRPQVLRALTQGGLLHDVGKIGVPDQILNKAGLLTTDERGEIEKHPGIGWEIVRQAPSLSGALAVVRHHHERMDGTGYPDRLAGQDIPLEARITAVADVWDALTSDRAYRPAWAPERALDVMLEGRGTHFDPDPLDVLIELLLADGIRPAGGVQGWVPDEACHPADVSNVVRHATIAASSPAPRLPGTGGSGR